MFFLYKRTFPIFLSSRSVSICQIRIFLVIYEKSWSVYLRNKLKWIPYMPFAIFKCNLLYKMTAKIYVWPFFSIHVKWRYKTIFTWTWINFFLLIKGENLRKRNTVTQSLRENEQKRVSVRSIVRAWFVS